MEETGATKLDSRVRALAEEASSSHQQLLASLAEKVLPPSEEQLEGKRKQDDVSTSGRSERGVHELLEQALRKQEEFIAAVALSRGQEGSREYRAARETLLLERRAALKAVANKVHRAEQALDEVLETYSSFKRPKHEDTRGTLWPP